MKNLIEYNRFILEKEDKFADYPKAASKNAKQAIEWKEKYGRDEVQGGTAVGWQRAHQLAKGEAVSRDVVGRMAAFNRHRKNSKVNPEYKDTPWKDNGYIAWLIWGGDEGVDWAIEKMDQLEESVNEAMSVKVGEYIKTEYGYYYKRVAGKVGGQEAFVEIENGKERKKKTSIHNSTKFEIVDAPDDLQESVTFSIDDGNLDDKFLGNRSLSRNLDYKKDGEDTYYTLPKRDFDRFEDWADSHGFDTELIYVVDESLNEGKVKLPKEILKHKDIPTWAEWVAQHSDGEWTWYESYPYILNFKNGGGAWKQEERDGYQVYTGVKTNPKDWKEGPYRVRYNGDIVLKESVNENIKDAAWNIDKIFPEDYEFVLHFQDIEDNGTVEDMIEFIELHGNEEMLSRYGIRNSRDIKKLAKHIMKESVNEKKDQTNDQSPIDGEGIETGLKKKAKETGVPIGLLRIIMRRGMAAWKSGHRPGTNQTQWGYARVNSFLTKGDGTWGKADADIAKKVRDGGHDKKL